MSYLLLFGCGHLSAMEIDLPRTVDNMISLKPKPKPGQVMNIDRESRTIENVIIAEVGEAEGHGFSIEKSFLEDVIKFVRKDLGGRLQCNMGHRWDANFFQLGRFDKLKLSEDGQRLTGTLTIYEAADNSPVLQNMASWFIDLAAEDPEAVMCSMTFRAAGFYQYDDKGNKVYIQNSWYGPVKQFEKKPAYAEFLKIFSCDIVDRGALTNSLFSDGAQNAARMFHELVSAPDFPEFFKANEEQFPFFADHYQSKDKSGIMSFFANLFSNHKQVTPETTPAADAAQTPAPAVQASEAQASTTDVQSQIEAALKPVRDELTSLKEQLKSKDQEIAALKESPAATPVSVKDENPSRIDASETNLWESNPINQRAKSFQRKTA